MNIHFVEVDGLRTRYLSAGEGGPALVLLHAGAFEDGGVGHNAYVWETVIPRLARERQVIALESPGYGGTAPPLDDEGFALPAIVAHLQRAIEILVDGPVHLVGHDEGGQVAIRLASQMPHLIRSCGIVAARAVAPAGDPLSNLTLSAPLNPRYSRAGQAWVLERISAHSHHVGVGRFLDEAVAAADSEAGREIRSRLADGLYDRVVRPSLARARVANWIGLRQEGMPVPTLLIWGADDPLSPMENAHALFRLIAPSQPVAQLKFIGRAGAMPFREQPETFSEMLGGWLRAIDGGRT